MLRIGLLSDTHSWLDPKIFYHFDECDEIWHAGDIGQDSVLNELSSFRPTRAVYGNIDSIDLQHSLPLNQQFELENIQVFMTHIGGYPGRYTPRVRKILDTTHPRLYICGHSHILKIMPDKKRNLIHINPGACGREGFHKVRTLVRFTMDKGQIHDVDVIELGIRGKV